MKTFEFKNKKASNYFEGWYYRITDEKANINIAIIFAVTKDVNNPHSFIQYYNGIDKVSHYYTFDVDKFRFDYDTNTVFIGDNYLSIREAHLHTDDIELHAEMINRLFLESYQKTFSAMGKLSDAPLECFQEVIYLDSDVDFTLNGTTYSGKSYMEKTYGTNFPSKWIWLQSNYAKNNSAITFSVGLVPVLFFKIKGFFLIVRYNNQEHRFGSYNLSRLRVQESTEQETTFTIRKGFKKVVVTAKTNHPVELVGPRKNGIMDLAVHESLDATATIQIYHHKKLVFEDTYTNVGLELMYNK